MRGNEGRGSRKVGGNARRGSRGIRGNWGIYGKLGEIRGREGGLIRENERRLGK